MTFELIQRDGTFYGYKAELPNSLFFFGFQNCSADILATLFPQLKFYQAQQVHGTTLVKAPFAVAPEADAVWSDAILTAPAVITADCLPVLILHPQFSAAIHAGWRGVLAEIVPKTVATLMMQHKDISQLKICIGPHIQAKSFEVGPEVVQSFRTQLPYFSEERHQLPHTTQGKSYIHLSALVTDQLNSVGVTNGQIFQLSNDTISDSRWASFRRDKQRNLRNISFAARLK